MVPHHGADVLGRDLCRAAIGERRHLPLRPGRLSGATFRQVARDRSANTSPSSSELDASRLAPCTPVRATSPTA